MIIISARDSRSETHISLLFIISPCMVVYLERQVRIELTMRGLQSRALPLDYWRIIINFFREWSINVLFPLDRVFQDDQILVAIFYGSGELNNTQPQQPTQTLLTPQQPKKLKSYALVSPLTGNAPTSIWT